MADKKFSELETASEIKNSDFMALSQDTGNGLVSLKATILAIATKILTAINFTSALSTTDKTVIGAINEVAQGGGGGGAGHTILDDDGTALAQEDDLQFKGVYSVDNSTDGVTEVNVYREMTKAEFDLLSDDEKKGFIKTTDEPDIASIVDGVFIDADNVIKSTTTFIGSMSYTATEDCFISFYIVMSSGDGTIRIDNKKVAGFIASSTVGYSASFYVRKGQIITVAGAHTTYSSDYTVYGIQQGSQVVKYNYSTDEQIVGTWIDGKTLYEKTVVSNAQVQLSDSAWTTIPFASGVIPTGVDTMFVANSFNPSDSNLIQDNRTRFIYDSGAIKGATSQIGGQTVYAGLTLTIRYTKSTS